MITLAELLNYRLDYMKQLVANDSEKIQQLNELVVQHIKEDKLISNNMNEKMEKKLTFTNEQRIPLLNLAVAGCLLASFASC